MTWAPHVRLAARDCRTLNGEPHSYIDGDLVHLTPSDNPAWLRATVRYFASDLAPTPDYLQCLVRRSALPEDTLRLLGPEAARVQP